MKENKENKGNIKTKNEIFAFLPQRLVVLLGGLSDTVWNTLEEIRLRKLGPILLVCGSKTMCIDTNGKASKDFFAPHICDSALLDEIVHISTDFSPYAYEKYLSDGYVTVRGGHRIGICGTAVIKDDKIRGFKNVSSVIIRIARTVENFGVNIARLINNGNICLNTAVISPPKCGKTTLLRNLARLTASGCNMRRVCIVDERGEICAMHNGTPQFDVGVNTCVIDGCTKNQGVEIALRTMSPDVIICDEIYDKSEADILCNAVCGGVSVIYAVHGKSADVFSASSRFANLADLTECCVQLSSRQGPGTIENVRLNNRNGGEKYA